MLPEFAVGTALAPKNVRERGCMTTAVVQKTHRSYDMRFQLAPLATGAAIIALLAAAGCATTPIPNEKIAVAKASLQHAEQSGAPELAPVEMSEARDKLSRAEKAAADHDAQPATELAEQANIDAQLAEATAQEKKSHKAAMEFDASMQALRQESMRSSQPAQ
jgi:uncharacterized iron-regulated membrane protein